MKNAAQIAPESLYEFTRGERMKKALRVAGISRADMAEYLGVTPETVSTWTGDRIAPSVQTMRLWALRTGAPHEWLVTGSVCTPPDLNREPTDSGSVVIGPWGQAAGELDGDAA